MPDFGHLLRKSTSDYKRPPVLPEGHYSGMILSHEFGESRTNKLPFVRFMVRLLDWPSDAPYEWDVADSATKTIYKVNREAVDLTKRQMRRDFFLKDSEGSDEILWRLTEFLKSIGLEGELEQLIPQATGAQVLVEVQQYVSDKGEVGNQIGALRGAR